MYRSMPPDGPVEEERLGEAELVVLRARALLQGDRERFAAAQEVRRLERQLPEEAFVLRHARAEGELVAVLLLHLEPDVDLVLGIGRLLDVDRLVLQLLEVAQLVEAADAVLERLGVEDVVLVEPQLAPDDVVVRGVVADKRDAVDEVLLALLHPHGDVDDRSPGGGSAARHVVGRRVLGARQQIGKRRELEEAAGAVDLARLLEALADVLLAVVLARLHLEERHQRVGLHDVVAREIERADAVPLALGDRHAQLDPARRGVVGVLDHLDRGLPHLRRDVALFPVVVEDVLRVLGELLFLVRPPARDEGEEPLLFVPLHLRLQLAVADVLVPDELDVLDPDLRPLVDHEAQVHELGPARQLADLRPDLRVLVALLRVELPHDAGHPLDLARIDERVEADDDVLLAQLLLDLRDLDLLRADVVDDLDPLPLLHVVDDVLADDAVVVRRVGHLNPQVVEEVGLPQPVEVLEHVLLVVRHPAALRRHARPRVDVVQVGLRVDHRLVDGVELELDEPHERPRVGRRQGRRLGRLGLGRARRVGRLRRRRRHQQRQADHGPAGGSPSVRYSRSVLEHCPLRIQEIGPARARPAARCAPAHAGPQGPSDQSTGF